MAVEDTEKHDQQPGLICLSNLTEAKMRAILKLRRAGEIEITFLLYGLTRNFSRTAHLPALQLKGLETLRELRISQQRLSGEISTGADQLDFRSFARSSPTRLEKRRRTGVRRNQLKTRAGGRVGR
jgi:hypothetical protein